jgi:hypothetical protein
MPTASFNLPRAQNGIGQRAVSEHSKAHGFIAWSSFFFALLQSICTFFAAVDGVRLAIGLGALVVSAGVGATMRWLHDNEFVRLPMIVLALIGSLLNLVVLWQVRRLRARPSARWRMSTPSRGKIRMERAQFILSIVTLVLIAIEEYWHFRWHHHL